MTAFVAEGRRLGIQPPFLPSSSSRAKDDEGLCITGCGECRAFRNEVREAMFAEEASLLGATERLYQNYLDSMLEDFARPIDADYDDWDAGYDAGFEAASLGLTYLDIGSMSAIERITSAINLYNGFRGVRTSTQAKVDELIDALLT